MKLIKRLEGQLSGKARDPKGMAYALMNKAGNMKGSELTAKGRKREAMGAAGRAKDRAAKASGGSPQDYAYNSKTNRATKR